jgi:hypothetical protein
MIISLFYFKNLLSINHKYNVLGSTKIWYFFKKPIFRLFPVKNGNFGYVFWDCKSLYILKININDLLWKANQITIEIPKL